MVKIPVDTYRLTIDGKTLDFEEEKKQVLSAKSTPYKYVGGYTKKTVTGKGVLCKDGKKYLEGTWKNGKLIKGKEYDLKDEDKIIYEGSFKNGLYDGKGVLFDHFMDEKYEGGFKKGKKDGVGKICYHEKDFGWILEYEGSHKNDVKNGYGKSFIFDSNQKKNLVTYIGNFKNNKFDGKGTKYERYGDERYDDDYYITGTFRHGVIVGKATEFYMDGKVKFEGTFDKCGRRDGNGTEYYKSGHIEKKGKFEKGRLIQGTTYYDNENNSVSYKGTFRKFRGSFLKGTSYWANGRKKEEGIWDGGFRKGKKFREDGKGYEEGEYKYGKRNGKCKLYYNKDNTLYDKGEWDNDYRKGLHYIFYDNGQLKFKGYFDYDKKGKGKEYWENGNVKEVGVYRSGALTGKGKRYFSDGKIKEDGEFSYGYFRKGTKYLEDGEIIVGEFLNNKLHGKCTIYWAKGKKKSVGNWENGRQNGLFTNYYYSNGKPSFKGMYKDGLKNGPGTEYCLTGKVDLKGYWYKGNYIGKVPHQTLEQKQKKLRIEENHIKKYMQTNDTNHLKNVKPSAIKLYLKTYAKKDAKGKTKASLLKELHQWRKQVKQQKPKQHTGPTVFDVLQSQDVPLSDFLKEEDRVVLKDGNHYYGAYLEETDIFYECKVPQIPFYSYIGNENVKGIIRLTTDQGKFYFLRTDSLIKDMKKGYNFFEFQTEPQDVRVLSKKVAQGADFVSTNHCDPKDVIKLSKTIKKEKIGKGLKLNVEFHF